MRNWKIVSNKPFPGPRISHQVLRAVEAVLPAGDGEGITLGDVWRRIGKIRARKTVHFALKQLRHEGRATARGPSGHFLYSLPRAPDAEGAASVAHLSGICLPEPCAGPSPSGGPAPLSRTDLTPEILRQLVADGLTDGEIARRYRLSGTRVHARRMDWGIASKWGHTPKRFRIRALAPQTPSAPGPMPQPLYEDVSPAELAGEDAWEAAQHRRRPRGIRNVTAILMGDPPAARIYRDPVRRGFAAAFDWGHVNGNAAAVRGTKA